MRERLLAGTGGLALTSAIQVKQADVLHGMGGIGKSVLARALCDDPDVQAAFPDGILWATLGQTPDLTARLREWIETLGGVVGQTAPTLDQLRNTLAEALRDKACLLIVDDAWRKAHLEPFCAGGPRCRLLITTRDAALAEGLDAGVYPVPVMAPDQAVALLEEWAQGSLAEVEAEVKAKIVRRLGCLPLAVRLAGAQLRQKDPAEWLAELRCPQAQDPPRRDGARQPGGHLRPEPGCPGPRRPPAVRGARHLQGGRADAGCRHRQAVVSPGRPRRR